MRGWNASERRLHARARGRDENLPSLAGREDITASRIASRAEELYAEESSSRRELGDVESTHVKTAARALATYETLRPSWGTTRRRSNSCARAGRKTATTMNGGLVRGALMLSGNRARALGGMVANVTNDLARRVGRARPGSGQAARRSRRRRARITRFLKRDVAFLTTTTCCSLDVEVWFGNVTSRRRAQLARSASGDASVAFACERRG